jgi:hypothetical protein
MSESSADEIEQRMARLEQQDQRLIRAIELLAGRTAAPADEPRRDRDALAAVIASFIGLLALGVSGYTAYVQREQLRSQGEQLRAQVWPHVQLAYNNTGSVGMFVTNQGAGPAKVIAMRVAVNGAAVTHWSDVKRAAGYAPGEGIVISQINGSVIPAGKEIAIVRPDDGERSRARFQELLIGGSHGLEVTLCYCSVLHECWATGANLLWQSDVPGPPASCPITVAERFLE